MLDRMRLQDFENRLGEAFGLQVDGRAVALELTEASPLGAGTTASERVPFSLVFRAPADLLFEQTICELDHPELGTLALFLVPLGPDGQGIRYEAVFN